MRKAIILVLVLIGMIIPVKGTDILVNDFSMTGDSSPSPYVASASSVYDGSYLAFQAFDNDDTKQWIPHVSALNNGWVRIDLGANNQTVVSKYSLQGWTDEANSGPKDFTLQGSNDASSWTTLDTQTGITWSGSKSWKNFSFDNLNAYRYYRVNVTNTGNGNELDLTEIDFYKVLSPTAPTITSVNCTSCNPPSGDNESPYTSSGTTPTFSFFTSVDSYCAIGDENQNYSTMGTSRNCTSGEGGMEHICTLTVQDNLTGSTDYVYISCSNSGNNNQTWNATEVLEIELIDLDTEINNQIDDGIHNSVIWPGATIYSDQQVYLRNLNNEQLLVTVDRVAVYGSQRWIFNYDNTTALGLFNITPSVYALDMVNLSLSEIESQVTALIDSTKN